MTSSGAPEPVTPGWRDGITAIRPSRTSTLSAPLPGAIVTNSASSTISSTLASLTATRRRGPPRGHQAHADVNAARNILGAGLALQEA